MHLGNLMDIHGQYIESGPISLWVEVLGSRSSPAIVLISGAGASARFWTDPFSKNLVDAGYCVIRFIKPAQFLNRVSHSLIGC